MHIVLDAGHGGVDPGAQRFGLKEADITLKVTKSLAKLLSANPNFKVTLTRKKNRRVSLEKRAEIANKKSGDLFLSIHANASTSFRARGVEFYLQNQIEPTEEALLLLAQESESHNHNSSRTRLLKNIYNVKNSHVANILDDLFRSQNIQKSDLLAQKLSLAWNDYRRVKNNSIRQAPFYLVANVKMPSVLVELGYISHSKEVKFLSSKQHQNKMAKSLYQGILQFKEILDKENNSWPNRRHEKRPKKI